MSTPDLCSVTLHYRGQVWTCKFVISFQVDDLVRRTGSMHTCLLVCLLLNSNLQWFVKHLFNKNGKPIAAVVGFRKPIIQWITKLSLSSQTHISLGFSFWYKKASNDKKESFCCTELKDCLPNLPLTPGKAKKKIKVFYRDNFVPSRKKVFRDRLQSRQIGQRWERIHVSSYIHERGVRIHVHDVLMRAGVQAPQKVRTVGAAQFEFLLFLYSFYKPIHVLALKWPLHQSWQRSVSRFQQSAAPLNPVS